MVEKNTAIELHGFPALMSDVLIKALTAASFEVVTPPSGQSPDAILLWADDSTAEAIGQNRGAVPTIVISDTEATARKARGRHTVAVCARTLDLESLLLLVHATASGEIPPSKVARESPATDRELEVMELVAQGFGIDKIAATLTISPHTVRTHIQHVISRLGVNSRAAAVVQLTDDGLIAAHRPDSP